MTAVIEHLVPNHHTDVVCPTADCPDADACSVCDVDLCTEHSNAFTSCAEEPHHLHHHDCVRACRHCLRAEADESGC